MKFTDTKFFYLISTFILIMLVAFGVAAEEKQPSPEKAAVVNGAVITKKDYSRELNLFIERIVREGRQISESQFAKIKVEILDSLIDRELLYQESQKIGIMIPAQDIAEEITAIKQRFPSEDEFKIALTRMDLTEITLKSNVKQRMAVQKIINEKIGARVVITDNESKEFYSAHPQYFEQPKEVRARHILIKLEVGADDAQKTAAQQKINMIQQKLKNGENFDNLAKEYSEGPSSVNGGDLGFFSRGQMVKPFEDAAFALQLNEISDAVQTRFGYHIIKVVEIKPERTIAYEEIKERLKEHLKQKKTQEEVSVYVHQLRKTAKIEKFI